MDYSTLGLPQSIISKVQLNSFEDAALAILRRGLPEIPVHSEIPPAGELTFPFILAYRGRPLQNWKGDRRGVFDVGRLNVATFATDPEGQIKAELISEAIRVVMQQASNEHWVLPQIGSVSEIKLKTEATRSPDWETSAGPVQFADLPGNTHRYAAEYELILRAPRR